MSSVKPMLVTGATGKQGSSVVAALDALPSSKTYQILAVTRNPNSASAQKLLSKHPSIHLIQGDLDNISELFDNAENVLKENNLPPKIHGVYSVQISLGPGVTYDGEITQGKSIIDESLSRHIAHFVYSSVDRGGDEKSWHTQTPIPHFQTKFHIEHYLREKAGANGERMAWTVLRPVAFMENLAPGVPTKVFLAALRDTMKEKPNEWVSIVDIGKSAARAFDNPSDPRYKCKAVGVAGDRLTFAELSACFERVTGYPAPATYGFAGSMLMWAVKEVNVMISWFASDGYGVDVERLRREEGVVGFEEWLRERSEFVKR